MKGKCWVVGWIACMLCGMAWAEPQAPVVEAQPAAVSDASGEATPPGDVPYTPEQLQLINQTIDAGKIDIDLLRQVVEGEGHEEVLRMSLAECIRTAIDQNPDLQVVRFEPLKSEADIMTARGEFDPVASETATYLNASQEASPEYKIFGGITSIESENTNSKTSLSGKLETGTLYDVSFGLEKQTTTYTLFRSQYSGGLTLTLSQPLLKGRSIAANTARIRMAQNARQGAEAQVRLAVMNVVAEVVKAYWDLVGAAENLTVREDALSNAERLLDISQKRLDIGSAAAIEVLQAKAGVAMRQTDLITARSQVTNSEDVLKQFLNLRDGDLFSSKRLIPTDRPEVADFNIDAFRDIDARLKSSIDLALANRPEMALGRIEIETSEIDRKRASDMMLPQLDVTGTLFRGKRGGAAGDVFEGIYQRRDHAYSVGLKAGVPIGNRAARGAYQRADLTARQAEQKLEKTKQELMLKVRLAMRALNTSQILVESNRQARTLQETNVAAEEKRLRLGVSTSYRVLQVQQDLTAAQTQEVQARVGVQKATVDLRLAEGTILDSLGIDFLTPESEPPVSFIRSVVPLDPKQD